MNNSTFYVYEHWRPDTDVCFYVGKGKDKRAWDMRISRNRHHKFVVKKLKENGFNVIVKLISINMSEQDAFNLEIKTIEKYGLENLTNMTIGGDGLNCPNIETRNKISTSQKKRFERPEEREAALKRNLGRKHTAETRAKVSAASTGRRHTPETIEKMREAAKARGISDATRAAQRAAVTGKKRKPFSQETRDKMRASAIRREQEKKRIKEA